MPLRLSAHIMAGRVKILEIYLKSEEIISFYPYFHPFADFYKRYVEQNCHILVTTLYNLNFTCRLIQIKENLKYWTETRNMKILYVFITYFVHL